MKTRQFVNNFTFIYLLFLILNNNVFAQKQINNNKLLYQHWILQTTQEFINESKNADCFSPYRNLIIMENGFYILSDAQNYSFGKWKVLENKLGLQVLNQGSEEIINMPYDFSWIIDEITEEKITLKIQGRHGYVYYFYKKA